MSNNDKFAMHSTSKTDGSEQSDNWDYPVDSDSNAEDIAALDALEGVESPLNDNSDNPESRLNELAQQEDSSEDVVHEPEVELESLQAVDSEWHQDIEPESLSPDDLEPVNPTARIERESLVAEDWAGYSEQRLVNILEAALFSYGKPLPMDKIRELFHDRHDTPSKKCLKFILQGLTDHYQFRGVRIVLVKSGYRIQTASEITSYIHNLWDERPNRYSRATLETLALIAYRQPITRGEIEDVRGVSVSSQIIKSMMERDWVRIVGHRDVPGRPALYATTKNFLDYFCLENLEQLPSLSEIRELEDLMPDLGLEGDSLPDSGSKEATFNELVEKLKSPEEGDLLTAIDQELAEDLAATSAINDSFESMLAAQREQLAREQKESEGAESADIQDTDSDNQIEESETDNSIQPESIHETQALSEEEQMRVIQEKLAEQQAIIENKDKEESNDEF